MYYLKIKRVEILLNIQFTKNIYDKCKLSFTEINYMIALILKYSNLICHFSQKHKNLKYIFRFLGEI